MDNTSHASQVLAAAITRKASKQTYLTVRFLVDRPRIADAYRAYSYFRWVDDVLDAQNGKSIEKLAFIHRQESLLETAYRKDAQPAVCAEESMLLDLVRHDSQANSGLKIYLQNMMAVMRFDVDRRQRVITQAELALYSHYLATAVTEALFYFIGHDDPAPHNDKRYLAVTAAHIVHMLRDTREDVAAGYYNIPSHVLQEKGISPQDVDSHAYRQWVCYRVRLARKYFQAGRQYLTQVENLRCRLAGYAYIARFEWVLHAIQADHYCLRPDYSERRGLEAGLWMGWSTLVSAFASPRGKSRWG